MKWFKHDGNALHDPKIEKLIMKYGIEGYGLYFACVEIIAGNLSTDNINFELEHDAEILAYKFKIDTLKVNEMMKYMVNIGLFQYNDVSGRVACYKLANRLDNTLSQNVEFKKMINSDEFKDTLSNFKELTAQDKTRQEKTRQENNKEGKIPSPAVQSFETLWNKEIKKTKKARAKTLYLSLLKKGIYTDVQILEMRGKHQANWNAQGKSIYITTLANWIRDEGWEDDNNKNAQMTEADIAKMHSDYIIVYKAIKPDGWIPPENWDKIVKEARART